MILTMYDLSGIQSYIFATNKLREMVGASFIVNEALFQSVPCLLGEKKDAWEEEAEKGESFCMGEKDKKIVYIGGGNALVAFKTEEIEKDFTRDLQKMIFEKAGGALKLYTASVDTDKIGDKKLAEYQKDLMDELDENKRKTPNTSTAKGFSINAHENTTFEPVLLFKKNDELYFATKSKYLKEEKYLNLTNSGANEKELNIFGLDVDDIKFTDNVDDFNDKDNKKSYLAVIHIDGNTMGSKIREFAGKQTGNVYEGLGKLRKLSYEINKTYKSVLKDTIEKIYQDKEKDKIIPFRPVIVDGDDVTVICDAINAFDFVKIFMQKLDKKKLPSLGDFALTAAAGIAFVNKGFPFYTAYDIAEQCCKNAKKQTLRRKYSGKADEKPNKSSMDFHICYSGVTQSVSEFREENYVFNKKKDCKKYVLNIRPYVFTDDDEIYSFEKGFVKEKNIIDEISEKSRNKLKGLRNAYGESVLAAKTYGDFLSARAEGEEEKIKAGLKSLEKPFYCKEKDGVYYAKFFDVLDVLDFINPEKEEKKEVMADEKNI